MSQQERRYTVKEYKYKNATVRIHGDVNRENLEKATATMLKKVVANNKKKERKVATA